MITAFAGFLRTNVPVVIVDAFIGSLNVAVTVVFNPTPDAPLAGVLAVIVGAVVSPTVVNDHAESAARALPAESFTPLEPPVIVAV